MYQALSRFSVQQAMESWVGPGNEAIAHPQGQSDMKPVCNWPN